MKQGNEAMRQQKLVDDVVSERDAFAALKVMRAYLAEDTATLAAARAALKTIDVFARQREADVRAEAWRLRVRDSASLAGLLKSIGSAEKLTHPKRLRATGAARTKILID
jgi:hypothetical protein